MLVGVTRLGAPAVSAIPRFSELTARGEQWERDCRLACFGTWSPDLSSPLGLDLS